MSILQANGAGLGGAGDPGGALAGGVYSYPIDQSLRFEEGGSAYLTFTPSSSGTDNKKYTFSVWIKLAQGSGDFRTVFSSKNTGGGTGQGHNTYAFGIDDDFEVYTQNGGANPTSPRRYLDRGAWYHFCIVYDTTQATDTDRVKVYVNGTQQADYTGTFPTLNSVMASVNTNGQEQRWGRYVSAFTRYFNGYMAEIHMVDGQALSPTDFGEEIGGVWVPKEYADNSTTSHGVNGYHLTFQGKGTATTTQGTTAQTNIGDDQSGNGNNFSVSGLAASDVVLDSPTNNFGTINVSHLHYNMTFKEGNLRHETSTNNRGVICNFLLPKSGKWYWEHWSKSFNYSTDHEAHFVGINTPEVNLDGSDRGGRDTGIVVSSQTGSYNGSSWVLGVRNDSYDSSGWEENDGVGVIYDADNQTISWKPSGGTTTTPISVPDGDWLPYVGMGGGSSTEIGFFNFGQDGTFAGETTSGNYTDANGIGNFKWEPPADALALCTANLPEPTIGPNSAAQADDYFNTVLYTGTGATQSITGVGFQPDWTWVKRRAGTQEPSVTDSVRGVNSQLRPASSAAESTQTDALTSFDADGFTLGADTANGSYNNYTDAHVAWNWKAGGTASSIAVDAYSSGVPSIASSVSAAPDAGFSIVSYTGTSAVGTIGHGLAEAPQVIFWKNRDATGSWLVWHHSVPLSSGEYPVGFTNLTNSFSPLGTYNLMNATAPTSSVFTTDAVPEGNGSGNNIIAYCFHSVEGYSKFGSYVGNSSATDGTFVYTGFSPAFVLGKVTTQSGRWWMYDSARSPQMNYAIGTGARLEANSAAAEIADNNANAIQFLSDGFKVNTTNSEWNNSSQTYIYFAFAEAPFKYANAR